MKVLITGITGFVGSHLAELILKENHDVYGIIRWRSRTDNIDHIKDKINLIEADIKDPTSIRNALEKIEPDEIYHLAAQSFVPTSWHAPQETLQTNIIGTVNLFEGVRTLNIDPKIQIAGSSEEYGRVLPNEIPIKETNELRPLSPYGVSKVAQDRLAYQYHESYGLKTIITRAFNHSGPRRGDVFVDSNFCKQVAEIEKKKRQPTLMVGNLEAKRDFTDVRDIVRAYWLSLKKCKFGEAYNICSGKSIPINKVLEMVLDLSHAKNIEVKEDQTRLRPSDVPILEGDCSKFIKETGWKPTITYKKTLEDMLNYWRERA